MHRIPYLKCITKQTFKFLTKECLQTPIEGCREQSATAEAIQVAVLLATKCLRIVNASKAVKAIKVIVEVYPFETRSTAFSRPMGYNPK